MTVGTGNCRVCGKQVIFEYEEKMLTTEILDKQKCSDSRCHGVGLLPPRSDSNITCFPQTLQLPVPTVIMKLYMILRIKNF